MSMLAVTINEATGMALGFALGVIFMIILFKLVGSHGVMCTEVDNEGDIIYRLKLEEEPSELKNKKFIMFRVSSK
jgi:hypothetical protein